ncbi:hypothetical protein QBC42DRAFT_203416 [Cladorrhinum samala]|uniref:Uncharacterized protein n=1 Tax=Cladorrhinum samala TaxID=585594 RepID=A0AAV9HL54_9PEZI|nr:hypothetical protein QBC42DRAFT_203416 [Cladorrhinum samala]
MESISYSLATADRLKSFIHSELQATDNRVTNDQEAHESAIARTQAMSALQTTKSLVASALTSLRSVPTKRPSKRGFTAAALGVERSPRRLTAAATGTLPDAAKDLVKSMSSSSDGLGGQSQSLGDMAKSIEPIVTSFDDVLRQPFLDKFSASLNTVPVVGIKNNQVMYLATLSSVASKTGTKNAWRYFSALPDGATVDASTNVHLFPYKGNLYISIGRAVWMKKCRDLNDPTVRQQAVDNWPKMYVDQWQKIGDEVLPAADLRDVIPFAVLSADRKDIEFRLMTLGSDSAIQVLKGDDIYPSNEWTALQYPKQAADATPLPTWKRMAYWNNTVVALDDQSNLWDLQPKFQEGTYTIDNKTATESTSEFTATDAGPLVVRKDGFLYNRIVEDNPGDAENPKTDWQKGIAQDGVTNLGVASPGVLLDLNTLTGTLKSRYIDTQTAVYPVVNKISAFAKTHAAYLDLLLGAADDYAKAGDDSDKQDIAIKAGKGFVAHAKVWSKLLTKSVNATKTSVNIMTNQLHDVKTQLEVQLGNLQQKLANLEAQLKVQQDLLSKLQAAFWGAVAAMFLGMILGVVALASGVGAWALVGAGALFVAGFVAMIALGVKMSELAGAIADTEGQIRVTKTAIAELSAVVKNFTDLDAMYGTLNMFWGRMANNAADLQTMDDATAELLALDMFEDISSVIAAKKETNTLSEAATKYLDVLNKQGVIIPPSPDVPHDSPAPAPGLFAALDAPAAHAHLTDKVSRRLSDAHEALVNGDLPTYEAHMDGAFSAEAERLALADTMGMPSGLWYDIPSLNAASALFGANVPRPSAAALPAGVLSVGDSATSIENRVNAATPVVVGMLLKTQAMCKRVRYVCDQYKDSVAGNPTDPAQDRQDVLQQALDDCTAAQTYAAQANNAFVDVNHACQEYQQQLQVEQGEKSASMDSARASAEQQKRNIDIPWYVYLGGVIAISVYKAEKERDIDNNLDGTLSQLGAAITALKVLEQSGAVLNGHSLTWTDMATTVSGCLGGVYNILSAVFGQVLEDPTQYEKLLSVEWDQIAANTAEVLNILASRGVNVSPDTPAALAFEARGLGDAAAAPSAAASAASERVAAALQAPADLTSSVTSQAQQAAEYFSQMQTLVELPNLAGIVGYWDESRTVRSSLLEVVGKLRRQYVDVMAAQYPVVLTVHQTALLQRTRGELVLEGQLALPILLRTSLRSAEAGLRSAGAAKLKFQAASAGYRAAVKQIELNLGAVQQKLDEADKKISELGKAEEERSEVIGVIADAVALACAAGLVFASAGSLAPVAAALALAQQISLGSAATAAAVKKSIDSLGADDVEKLLAALRNVKQDLEAALKSLKVVQPIFADVVKAADGVEAAVASMVEGLESVQNETGVGALGEKNVEGIKDSWKGVDEACIKWMDVVNAQGIVPNI